MVRQASAAMSAERWPAAESAKGKDLLQQRHPCLCCCAGPETARAKVQALQPLSVRYGRPPHRLAPLCSI